MPLARIGDRIIFFVHVPKTGGTSIEAYLRAKGALALAGTRRHGWSRTTPQHMHREIFAEMVPHGFYDQGFVVLRDPKARLLSEFRMRAEPLRPKLRPIGLARVAWKRMQGVRSWGVRVGNRLEFLDFDSWVARSLAEAGRDAFYKDNHFRPQHEFVDPGHRIFRFEDGLARVFRWIDAFTGTAPAEGSFHERRSSALEIDCSPATDALIRDFYRQDYALLAKLEAEQHDPA